jgi:hypothetical protein
VGIALVMGSALMMQLRILGLAGSDQTLRQTTDRFGPWLTGALWLMLATGGLMVVGQPQRELLAFSFWLKMSFVAAGVIIAIAFQRAVRRDDRAPDRASMVPTAGVRVAALLTFALGVCIIVLGRLIAYDHVWGAWSPAGRQ